MIVNTFNYRKLITILIIVLNLTGYSQLPPFESNLEYINSSVYDITDFDFIDVNNDSLLDVVFTAGNLKLGHKSTWNYGYYLNNGNSQFSEQHLFSIKNHIPTIIEVVDMNNDGKPEFVFHEKASDMIYFASIDNEIITVIDSVLSDIKLLKITDVDGDSLKDIIYTTNTRLYWRKNLGGFKFANQYQIESNIDYIEIGEVDSLGIPLLIFVDYSNTNTQIEGYRYHDSATFVRIKLCESPIISLHYEDYNSDGLSDFIVLSLDNSLNKARVSYFENYGSDSFSLTFSKILQESTATSSYSIKTMKIDDDTLSDILINGTTWYRNNGLDSLTYMGYLNQDESLVAITNQEFIRTIDFNQDGFEDVFMAEDDNLSYAEHYPKSDSFNIVHLADPVYLNAVSNIFHNGGISTFQTDLNKDGLVDFVSLSKFGPHSYFFLGESDSSWSKSNDFNIQETTWLLGAHLDQDGNKDILKYKHYLSPNSIFNKLKFDSLPNISQDSLDYKFNVRPTYSFDVDGDGIDDFINHNGVPYWMKRFSNDSISDYSLIDNSSIKIIGTADMNNDGVNDLITVSSNSICWFEFNLNSGFIKHIITDLEPQVTQAYPTDFDQDGNIDLLTFSAYSGPIMYYRNRGTGNFTKSEVLSKSTLLGLGLTTYAPQVTDFNGDGFPDVVALTAGGGNVVYLEGAGNGTFKETSDQSIILYVNGRGGNYLMKPFDKNGDGDKEIFLIHLENGLVTTITNKTDKPHISSKNFFDENANGVRDSFERNLNTAPNILSPRPVASFSTSEYEHLYQLDEGTYKIEYDSSSLSNWELSTDSSSFTFVSNSSVNDSCFEFGFVPKDSIVEIEAWMTSSAMICSERAEMTIGLVNNGTVIVGGVLWLDLDTLISSFDFTQQPDTVFGNLYGWYISGIYPLENKRITMSFNVPGVDSFDLGDSIKQKVFFVFDEGYFENTIQSIYSEPIRCAYDPNDKAVSPQRGGDNYTLDSERLAYTIRFQNTGNYKATNVVLVDSLSPHLDVSSFNLLGSSHEARLEYDISNGLLTFTFENINLPDSASDVLGSQGYVTFSLRTKDNIPDSSLIRNKAEIYFDFNPPIVTNSTTNLIVPFITCYPIDTISRTGCDSVIIKNKVFYSSQYYIDTVYDFMCNTINYYDIVIEYTQDDSIVLKGCDSIFYNNLWYFYSDTVQLLGNTLLGCDSSTYTELEMHYTYRDNIEDTFILGSNYTLPSGKIVSAEGDYIDTISTINECDSIFSVNLVSRLASVRDYKNEVKWSVIPNPANTDISVLVDYSLINSEIVIYNSLGAIVYQGELLSVKEKIGLKTWNLGIYTIALYSRFGQRLGVRRFLKVN
jgi:uncharacterized repeat protein (TIGR01451 family)